MINPVMCLKVLGTVLLHCIWTRVLLCSVFPIPSFGVIVFFLKCFISVASIAFLNEKNSAQHNYFGPPLVGSTVFLLYPHFVMIVGNDTNSVFSLACQSRMLILTDILPLVGTLPDITLLLLLVSLLP